MPRLVSFTKFSRELSNSVALKAGLTGFTIISVCVPAAILLTFGFQERYVLTGVLAAIIPSQYLAFCFLESLGYSTTHTVKKVEIPAPLHESPLLHANWKPLTGQLNNWTFDLVIQVQLRQLKQKETDQLREILMQKWKKDVLNLTPILQKPLLEIVDDFTRPEEKSIQTVEFNDVTKMSAGLSVSELNPFTSLDPVIRLQRAPFEPDNSFS